MLEFFAVAGSVRIQQRTGFVGNGVVLFSAISVRVCGYCTLYPVVAFVTLEELNSGKLAEQATARFCSSVLIPYREQVVMVRVKV